MVRSFLLVPSRRSLLLRWPGVVLFAFVAIGASIVTESNLDRLEKCAAAVADSIIARIPGDTAICLEFAEHDAAWVVENALVAAATRNGVSLRRCASSDPGKVHVALTYLQVTLVAGDDDRVTRTATLGISALLPHTGSVVATLTRADFRAVIVDTIGIEDTAGLDGGYAFAAANVAGQSDASFWSRILEPAVVLAATAIIAILLFAVRSE